VGGGGSSAASFTSIPSTFKHLQIRYIARGAASATDAQFALQYNGFTSGYTRHRIVGDGSSVAANGSSGANSYIDLYDIPAATALSNVFGIGIIDILDYADTNKLKTFRFLRGDDRNGSGNVGLHSAIYTGTSNTNAITTIQLYCPGSNIGQYSSFALYGVKG
jgi:hypothetical protein